MYSNVTMAYGKHIVSLIKGNIKKQANEHITDAPSLKYALMPVLDLRRQMNIKNSGLKTDLGY